MNIKNRVPAKIHMPPVEMVDIGEEKFCLLFLVATPSNAKGLLLALCFSITLGKFDKLYGLLKIKPGWAAYKAKMPHLLYCFCGPPNFSVLPLSK